MMWGFYGFAWWWVLLGGLCMILFWGAVVWLVVWVIRRFSTEPRQHATAGETPLDIAQRRLARGDISREEYEEMRNTLQR